MSDPADATPRDVTPPIVQDPFSLKTNPLPLSPRHTLVAKNKKTNKLVYLFLQ